MKVWNAFKVWLDETRCGMGLLAIEDRYRKAGHATPGVAARTEIFIRAEYIERFRDDASKAFLRSNIPLAKVKEDFVRANLMAKVSVLNSLTTARVRDIIRAMPESEAYYGDALVKWNREFADWLREMVEAGQQEG